MSLQPTDLACRWFILSLSGSRSGAPGDGLICLWNLDTTQALASGRSWGRPVNLEQDAFSGPRNLSPSPLGFSAPAQFLFLEGWRAQRQSNRHRFAMIFSHCASGESSSP